jgi:DNA-binding XRE family transcriptional regulator
LYRKAHITPSVVQKMLVVVQETTFARLPVLAARDLKNSERTDLLSKNCSLNRDVGCPSVGTIFARSFGERSAMALRYAAKKAPNLTDRHVGRRVRMRRMMLTMSQEQLADALGVTYQQVQKYERGANRMGASRLQQMSDILQVPVEFFFEGAPNAQSHTPPMEARYRWPRLMTSSPI